MNGAKVASSASGAAPMESVYTIGQGEKIVDLFDEVKILTYQTGNEHAIVRLASGERVSGVSERRLSARVYAELDWVELTVAYDSAVVVRSLQGGGLDALLRG